ncbi:unnamed protein product [Lymnaea stagnalis]|uniref:Uncharacterized protein n=1 Tax=Lymnaea stagnalis TaxID=6523 RepID=A0AAV2HXM2_LYMST
MSAPQKNNSELELFNLSSWTLISSQGDILATDCDSESSESSVEVVSLEGREIVAFSSRHLERKNNVPVEENISTQPDKVNTSSSSYSTDQEPLALSLDCIQLQESVHRVKDAIITTQNADNNDVLTKNLDKQYETESFSESHSVSDLKHDFKYQNDNEETSHDTKHQNDNEDTQTVPQASNTLPVRNGDLPINKPIVIVLDDSYNKPNDESKDWTQEGEKDIINDEESISKDSGITTDIYHDNTEIQAACCLELLAERQQFCSIGDTQFGTLNSVCSYNENLRSSSPVSFEESDIIHLLEDSANLNSTLAHNDSDTDSDFVRLDSDHLDLAEGNGIVVMAMHRSDSSIGPTFSFMRAEGSQEQESPLRMIVNPEDLDRNDDTESSTEDDRIESEQSEADSFSFNNDVGDLSVFADIGDLPLDVGNVPRNYIHCPNNHLSTVLNIIVIIAAILTMGISLGIIMATDLEIEEWQNAYEVQNNKVYLLELQLQGKMKALQYKEKRVRELEPQLREMKSMAKMLKGKANSYATAMDILIEYSLMRKESTEQGLNLLKKVVQDYINCEKSNQDGSSACHLKVLALLKNPNFPEETKHLSHKNPGNSSEDSHAESKVNMPDKEIVPFEMNPIALEVDDEFKQDHLLVDSVPKAFAAFPIVLDIKHLQQSLTREQQRALHWQQLYLAERRQRERERENEELEDERDRELWEHEKEQLDQVECLKNITMFAQQIGRWNLSAFDDFANLSLLLSGVAELKQSVLDSIQRVWGGGREIQAEYSQNERILQKSKADKKMLYNYVNEVLNEIKDWPNKETRVEYLWNRISDVKQVLEYIASNKILVVADHVINKFDELTFGGENFVLSRLQIIELITQVFSDLKQELSTKDDVNEAKGKTFENSGAATQERRTTKVQITSVDDFSSCIDDVKKNSWHKQLGKIIKKTGVTVGQKMKKTWHNLKSLWHNEKSTWQSLKTMWHEKKPSIIHMAKGLKYRVMSVSSKFKKLCTDLQKALFRQGKEMVDIHSKCVYKARKQWQKEVYRDPCTVIGKFTAECNFDRKQIKKNLKRINHEFTQLLKISNVNYFKVLNHTKRVDSVYKQLRAFQKQWGNSKLLLKTDLDWVDCQNIWWLTAADSMHQNNEGLLEVNKCDSIRLQDNLNEGHCRSHLKDHFRQETSNLKSESVEELHGENNEYVLSGSENKGFSIAIDGEEDEYTRLSKNNNHLEVNDTQPLEEEWFLERARDKLRNRREKEKSDWVSESAAETREKKLDEVPQSTWVFKKAQYREDKRKEEHRADWLLERSSLHLACDEGTNECGAALKYSQHQYKSANWYLKQAEDRQKIRKQESASDWLFERAAQRKKMHKTSKFGRVHIFNENYNSKLEDHHYTKPYQQAYGKASSP